MGQRYSSVEVDAKRRAYVRRKIKPSQNQRRSKKKQGSTSEYTPVDGLPNLSRRRDSDSDESRSSGIGPAGPAAGGPGSGDWQSQMMQRAMGPPGGIGGVGGGGGGGRV